MRVAVIGAGHVGLITAATLASWDHDVAAIDSDREKIARLKDGQAPFFEPGLPELLGEVTSSGKLAFTTEPAEALTDREVVFICVGTPPRASGEANLVAIESASRDVARNATQQVAVVDKSTVPAGTAKRVKRTLKRERPEGEIEFHVVSNPEFLREGRAVEDSLLPDRVLIGAESPWAFEQMRAVYHPLVKAGVQLMETDIATAELAKHACNAFLSLKISFANSLARLCERAGADVVKVADVMGADPRIGRAFLNAGLGYGGYCFPKDLQAFERLASKLGYDFALLKEVERINDEAVDAAFHKVKEAVWNLEGKRIALFGLAFKPETDDTRFSPALALAGKLLEEGARVVGYDPEAGSNAKTEVPDLEIASDAFAAAEGAHCVVICTEWDEFSRLDLGRLRAVMAHPVMVDGRNVFEPAEMETAGFTYYPTGRPAVG